VLHLLLAAICFSGFCANSGAVGIPRDQQTKPVRHVAVPREVILPVIASQPDSPLQFEDVRYLAQTDGDNAGFCFRLRNRGGKPVRGVSFAAVSPGGGGWLDSWPRKVTSEVVMPGQVVPLSNESEQEVVVRLTDEVRDKLKLRGPMKVVTVLMVVRVKFADGSVYEDESTYKALQTYFEGLE
jgi:hypothetical protein